MTEIAKAQIEKLLKKYSGMRVSTGAIDELLEHIEDKTLEIASVSADLAATARRKTVTTDDVKLAIKQL